MAQHQADVEQARPLALSSPTIHPLSDEDTNRLTGRLFRRFSPPKRRCAVRCCGCCGATVVVLGVTILVLALTVFKVKDPEVTVNSLLVDRLSAPGAGTPDNPLSLNATLTADVSIKNRNAVSFRFQSSATDIYYGVETVGVVYAPKGSVRARRTVRMNVTVDVLSDRVVFDTNATGAAMLDGGVNMSSYTDMTGRVKVLGIYKRDVDILLNCTFTLYILEKNVANRVCRAHVN